MTEVSVRELRNNGGRVLERVRAGETLTVTHSGRPIAELRPLARSTTPLPLLLERLAQLPPVDPEALRRDIDAVIDQSL